MVSPKKRKKLFVEQFVEHGTIIQACRATGIPRSTVYKWRDDDPTFKAALDAAEEEATESLIAEARRRARDGVDEPVYYKGRKVDTVKKYSDSLLMFLIKKERPEYRDRVTTTLETPPGGLDINTYAMTPEERRKRIDELIAKRGDGTIPTVGTGTEVQERTGTKKEPRPDMDG